MILQPGAGGDLDEWNVVFSQLAQIAPVLAYDRLGLGQSEFDGVRPTIPLRDAARKAGVPLYRQDG